MWTPSRNGHIVTQLGDDGLAMQTMKVHLPLCDEEGLIVHLVPVWWGAYMAMDK